MKVDLQLTLFLNFARYHDLFLLKEDYFKVDSSVFSQCCNARPHVTFKQCKIGSSRSLIVANLFLSLTFYILEEYEGSMSCVYHVLLSVAIPRYFAIKTGLSNSWSRQTNTLLKSAKNLSLRHLSFRTDEVCEL